MKKKNKDGWFFSKSLLDEIYKIPIEEEQIAEEPAPTKKTIQQEEPSPVIHKSVVEEQKKAQPDVDPETDNTQEDDVIVYVKPSEKEENPTLVSERNTDEPFILKEHEGKLVYQKKST